MKTNHFAASALLAVVLTTSVCPVSVAGEQLPDPQLLAIKQLLATRYPNTKFTNIQRSPMPGVWEVWMGNNVAFITDDARYFIFGHMYDMATQTDLTANKREQLLVAQADQKPQISFDALPLDQAIKTVRGDGSRKVAVFSDPDCPYCKQLELELANVDNVTIYTFLFPLPSLHPQAVTKANAIWCSPDAAKAWQAFMLKDKLPKNPANCPTPVRSNMELAERYGIQGTPYLVFGNGSKVAGALTVDAIEAYLNRQK